MGELICISEDLLPQYNTRLEYLEKRKKILSTANECTERIVDGMIYCRKCYQPKMADFPERNFVTRCECQCGVTRWERERMLHPPKLKEFRQGDWSPFD